MKVYAGAPAAARHYVEADRSRADDYYLAEGSGLARRYTAADGRVRELSPLAGDAYEAWVAGHDPDTGEPRGRLRTDGRAVRFVEVVVNGPKTWSLAAALHPEIAAAYDAAQDRAAEQIIGWLSEHASSRVGPRGGQVQVPLQALEAVTVRHYTSRAGDPHRHLHLQLSARVFAAGKWRGLHTVGVRDYLNAINGIGHAAMACDPQFRAALATHGYVLDGGGETRQLADCVGPMSARAAQIERNLDRYEREWTAAHPGDSPGPALRQAWHTRGWAEARPDKVRPQPGTNLDDRWRTELAELGHRDPDGPVALRPTAIAALHRDSAADRALTRLAAARSAWNTADLRGEAEQLIAAAGIVADPAARNELAEDLTARAMARCIPLLQWEGVPEHIRAWTSAAVLEVEADLTARLAARGAARPADGEPPFVHREELASLDAGQRATVAALTGRQPLVVVEGAAGAGKTTALTSAQRLLEEQGRRLLVVTPTLKAAKVAAGQLNTTAGSAAGLAYRHGWRWNTDGAWTRPALDRPEPAEAGRLLPGDLLVIDEAGMLDQDTARALLTIADDCQLRVALLGDRNQLPAVGRGGVLDLAVRSVDPAAHLTLDTVHRFTRTDSTGAILPDAEYAALTLVMRAGDDPGAVFDTLSARRQIQLHPDAAARLEALAGTAAAAGTDGGQIAVVVDTREQAAELSAAIRDRLVAGGRVDDSRVAVTRAGERIGAGDRIATRRNDRDLGVANRDTWTVTAVGHDGSLLVTPAEPVARKVTRSVTPAAQQRRLPADYVAEHVELSYASTAHGVQGDTVDAAHLVIAEQTGAASAYVGMTRGRRANTAHLVAADLEQARQQWITVFGRDRADLGPAHAARQAAAEAARYARTSRREQGQAALYAAQKDAHRLLDRLTTGRVQREQLRQVIALEADTAGEVARLQGRWRQAAATTEAARRHAQVAGAIVAVDAGRVRDALLARWDGDRTPAFEAGRVLRAGPGRLGLRHRAASRAAGRLTDWADRWRPHLPQLPTDPADIARIAGRPAPITALHAAARRAAATAHPEHTAAVAAYRVAHRAQDRAWHALAEARRQRDDQLARLGSAADTPDPTQRLADLDSDLAAASRQLDDARDRIITLTTRLLTSSPRHTAQQQTTRPPAQQRHARPAGQRDTDRTPHRPVPVGPLTATVTQARLPQPPHQPRPGRPRSGPAIGR